MSKILITGATGFIGGHLVPAIEKAGHEVISLNSGSGDVADPSTWSKYPAADIVIHLAGKSFVPASWSDPSAFVQCNLMGTMEALNYCKKNNAKLVFLSSYLYGNPLTLPIAETATLAATNPYAFSKKLAEDACRFYAGNFGVDITIFRPFNVYGVGQPRDFLIPSIIRQVKNREDIHVKDLEPKRDYIYVQDVVSAVLAAIIRIKGFNVFNIGSGESYSVAELITLIQQISSTDLAVYSSGERRRDEIMNTVADITLASQKLNWSPQWSLKDGLRQVFDAE